MSSRITKPPATVHPANRLAPYNPTHATAIDTALDLLELDNNDVLFDLGCGEGRLLVRAATRIEGLKCVGMEIDIKLVQRGQETVSGDDSDGGGLEGRVEIRHGDVLSELSNLAGKDGDGETEKCRSSEKKTISELSLLDDATCIFVYLLPSGLGKVKPVLEEAVARHRRRQKGEFLGCKGNSMTIDMNGESSQNHSPRPFRVASYMFSVPGWTPTKVDKSSKGECPVYLYVM